MPQPFCLLSADRFDAGAAPDDQLLAKARDAGFDGIVWQARASLLSNEPLVPPGLAEGCRAAGLALILKANIRRIPVDHELVRTYPEQFRIQRSADERGRVDPRAPLPPMGEALARMRDGCRAELVDALCTRLADLAGDGVGGIWVEDAERIAAPILRRLLDAAASGDGFLKLAGPFGADRGVPDAVLQAGWDYLLCESDRPLESVHSLVAEVEGLRPGGAVLCQVAGNRSRPEVARIADLPFAATLGAGVIAPIEWLEAESGEDALCAAVDAAARCAAYDGEVRCLSASSAPVVATIRAKALDLRSCDRALIVLANRDDRSRPVPCIEDLSAAGAPFVGEDDAPDLTPHEIRILEKRRPDPVVSPGRADSAGITLDAPRLVLEHIEPSIDEGAFPAKRVVGDRVAVSATLFADGHEQLAAELRWRATDADAWQTARMTQGDNDRWRADFALARLGRHEFVIEGWLDRFGGFQRDFGKKVAAGVAQPVDRAEGVALIESAARRSRGKLAKALDRQLQSLAGADEEAATEALLSEELRALMDEADDRPHRLASAPMPVDAERIEARFSSWYELFPRSMAPADGNGDPARHGTFADVIDHLPRIRAMGFDTLYFPPIHPIGRANRKGPNNTLTPAEGDPGSPYAIGSAEGGHDAIHPELGSFDDFDRLVRSAAEHGLEIALDFAIQASPDHPWLEEHPGWFAWLPDGSMKYAENPPKKYQDIVNVDFYGPDAVPGLWQALRDVVLLWVEHGVKAFRVDNPHTKPLPFWEWMIAEVRSRHPEVIFLSEAFTRPTMMYRLAKVGFSQSYTYFTWRDRKHELTEYITELTSEAPKDFYRPHFFVNTPDINPFFLQTGGRPAHRIRAVLAATLSGLWGVYSGFELCDATPLGPGKEEYLDSEKYEIRIRDWQAQGNIIEDITRLNRLRRANPALQTHLNTRFYLAHDENVIWYGKPSFSAEGELREMIMVMVNLDPHHAHECDFEVPLWEFLLPDHASIAVEDLVEGHRFDWHGKIQHIRLVPDEPYRIWRLTPPKGQA